MNCSKKNHEVLDKIKRKLDGYLVVTVIHCIALYVIYHISNVLHVESVNQLLVLAVTFQMSIFFINRTIKNVTSCISEVSSKLTTLMLKVSLPLIYIMGPIFQVDFSNEYLGLVFLSYQPVENLLVAAVITISFILVNKWVSDLVLTKNNLKSSMV